MVVGKRDCGEGQAKENGEQQTHGVLKGKFP
jgi:hypothetical protein